MKIKKNFEPIVSGICGNSYWDTCFFNFRDFCRYLVDIFIRRYSISCVCSFQFGDCSTKKYFWTSSVNHSRIVVNETMGLSLFFSFSGRSFGYINGLLKDNTQAATNPLVAISMDLSFDYILFPVGAGSIIIILSSIAISGNIHAKVIQKNGFN